MSSLISYAQNFEDVMLWRALKEVKEGFYIDIGAQDPIVDSVSLAFYEQGWRGLHVEPTHHYATLLRQHRAGETVLETAVGAEAGMIKFYEIPATGISTADENIAQQHRERGFKVVEINVPCVSLASVFKSCGRKVVHWLKIDVEGLEAQVLAGWKPSKVRPWIVVVESTLPLTQIESYESWEPLLLGYGYSYVYFDGLNRFYVSNAKNELEHAFRAPPNVFDGFAFNGTASAPFCRLIQQRYEQRILEKTEALASQLSAAKTDSNEAKAAFLSREEGLSSRLHAEFQRANQHEHELQMTKMREAELSRELTLLNVRAETFRIDLNSALKTGEGLNLQLSEAAAEIEHCNGEFARREIELKDQIRVQVQTLQRMEADRQTAITTITNAEQQHCILQLAVENSAKELANRDRELLAKIATQKQRIEWFENELHQSRAIVGELNAQLSNRAAQLKRVEIEFQAQKSLGKDLANKLDVARTHLQGMNEMLFLREDELRQVVTSFSWRSTSIARSLHSFLFGSGTPFMANQKGIPGAEASADRSRSLPKLNSQRPQGSYMSYENDRSLVQVSAIASLSEILALDDEAFVLAAYQTVLGRPADSVGLHGYIKNLRAGEHKRDILVALASSVEGRARAELPQWVTDLVHDRKKTNSGMCRFWLLSTFASRIFEGERSQQLLENKFFLLRQALEATNARSASLEATAIISEQTTIQRDLRLEDLVDKLVDKKLSERMAEFARESVHPIAQSLSVSPERADDL